MSTVAEVTDDTVARARPQSAVPSSGDRFLLSGMSWSFYERLLEELGDRNIRVTYDRGDLELMAPAYRHENAGRVVGWLIDVVAEEIELPVKGGRSTTFRRKDVGRGIEPDDCFWIENIAAILGKDCIDLSRDPPPDLAIEVDVTSSSIDRLGVYAALRVPQVWRFDGLKIRVYQLNERGEYDVLDHSPTFPFLPLDKLVEFIERSVEVDDMTLRREFRNWLRTEVLPKLDKPQ